eukprot:TRINITY_DN9283_c0_g1_i2.p1 TRINITY_DN9283_c0_g1~~TRINITY_DN9283_c0_g1_i2.p1  ORF type:complete len:480 (-),score=114.42 TRINITY_DN9283_c0_g1_i2:104-1543(-)
MGSGPSANSSPVSPVSTRTTLTTTTLDHRRLSGLPVRISVKEASTRLEDIPSGTNFKWLEKHSMAASVASDVADLDSVLPASESELGVDPVQQFMQLVDAAGSELLDESDEVLRQVQTHLRNELLTAEQHATVARVAQMFWGLVPDLAVSACDFYMIVLLLFAFRFGVPTPGVAVADFELMRRANRYLRFASAAYGSKLVKAWKGETKKVFTAVVSASFSMPTTTERINNSRSVALHAGIKFEDIVCSHWKNEGPCTTGHYLAYDHSTHSVVLVLRGTNHVYEIVNELVTEDVAFQGGRAHQGMLEVARRKIALLRPTLEKCFRDHPTYKLVITGHSLGAGVAVLMAICVKEEMGVPVNCYAFASPPVVSRDLAQKCRDYVYTFVCNDDVVPRLSAGHKHDFELLLRHLMRRDGGVLVRLFQVAAGDNQLGPGLTQRISDFLRTEPIPRFADLGVERSSNCLYPAGRCFHLRRDDINQP